MLQLRAVDLRPGLDEALLRLRQAAVQALKRVDSEDSRMLLVEREALLQRFGEFLLKAQLAPRDGSRVTA